MLVLEINAYSVYDFSFDRLAIKGSKPKNRSRGYRERARADSQRQGENQTAEGFQEEDQFSYDQSYFTQRQHYHDGGRGQQSQGGMRHAQSSSSVLDCDQSSVTEERSRSERNKLRIRGLSESTTDDALTNFIEAMSGEEVKEVLRLRNGKAIVTMVNDITSKSICGVILYHHYNGRFHTRRQTNRLDRQIV